MDKDNEESLEKEFYIGNMLMRPNDDLGITKEYNAENRRKLWDDGKAKDKAKDRYFGDGNKCKEYDSITHTTLYRYHKEAKEYAKDNNEDNYALYAAEADHINALKDVHEIAKLNPFLSDSDFKKIMNSQSNLRITSKKLNASKGAKSDYSIIFDSKNDMDINRKKMLNQKILADISLHEKFTARTVKNIGGEIKEGADEAIVSNAIPLAMEGIKELIKASDGEQDGTQALQNFGKSALNIAKEGGKQKLKIQMAYNVMRSSKNSMVKAISQSNLIGQVVEISAVVCRNVGKYINGELTEKEVLNNIKKEGAILAAGVICGEAGAKLGTMLCPGIGTVAGQLVGQAVGMLVSGIVCNTIINVYETVKHLDDYKKKEKYIRALEEASVREMQKQKQEFDSLVENEYKRWDKTIYDGFEKIITYSSEQMYDLKEVTQGLNSILNLFNKQVAFDSLESYEAQLDQPLVLKI